MTDVALPADFDPAAYIALNEDLRLANVDPVQHYLEYGHKEGRRHSFSDPSIPIPFDQIPDLSRIPAAEVPFILIADSHGHVYSQLPRSTRLPLRPYFYLCSAGSAMGLSNPRSRSQYGADILKLANLLSRRDLPPILLKFGQVDAEFVWTFRRVEAGERRFNRSSFERFAAQSVSKYAEFLSSLKAALPKADLNVCSIFPPILTDAQWAEGYVNPHTARLEDVGAVNALRKKVAELEMPDLATRTDLHRHYNDELRRAVAGLGLNFFDDFNLLLAGRPHLPAEFGTGDHHLSPEAVNGILGPMMLDVLKQKKPRHPFGWRGLVANKWIRKAI